MLPYDGQVVKPLCGSILVATPSLGSVLNVGIADRWRLRTGGGYVSPVAATVKVEILVGEMFNVIPK